MTVLENLHNTITTFAAHNIYLKKNVMADNEPNVSYD